MKKENTMKILFVEDLPTDVEIAKRTLSKEGILFSSVVVETENDFINSLEKFIPDIIISDYSMPQFDGMRALKLSLKINPDTPFIILTGSMNEEVAVECMKAGATDYLIKDYIARLPFAVKEAIEQKKLRLEKKKVEEALHNSEARYRKLFEIEPECVKILSKGSILKDMNPAGLAMIDADSLEQVVGKSLIEIIDPEYQEAFNGLVQTVFQGKSGLLNFKITGLKGTKRWLETHAVPMMDEGGNIHSLLSVTRDITERKAAEQALHESEERFRSLYENATIGLYRTNPEGSILLANPALVKMLGYKSFDELSKRDLSKEGFEPNYPRTMFIDLIEKQGELKGLEATWKHSDGRTIFVRESAKAIRDSNGNTLYYDGTVEDITERKKAEQILQKLEMAIRNSHEVIFITDKEGIITYINPEFTKMYGYTSDEVIGKSTPRILKSGLLTNEQNKKLWDTILKKQKISTVSYKNKCKDGSFIDIEGSIDPILDESDDIIGFLAIQRDITQRKIFEKELIEAKEKAESSNKLKDAFIANMSHEIRTPLNGILGLSSIIKSMYAEHIKEEDEPLFAGIDHSSKRIIRTVDMILNYSRVQTGEFPINPMQIDLSEISKNLVREFANTADRKLISLSFENRCNGAATILADEYCITHSISNLIDNAIKYTDNGFVKVILYKGNADEILLSIKDSGIGISEEYLNHVFEPYQQEQIGYGRAYEGVGLGLSMVKKFLNLNSAEIFVESEKEKGSSFTINFGRGLQTLTQYQTERKADKIPVVPNAKNKPLVLLVEDDVFNQTAIKIFIQSRYDTIITDSSEGAMELMKKNKVDLVLMDISIKGSMNGLELTKEFKATIEYSSIPIIAITAHAFERDRNNAFEAGCDAYLSKPFTKSLLLETIAKHV
jgi:PAS domain S-box-containing protein